MKTIPPIIKISIFLLCIAISTSSFAQTLEFVENQPDYNYYESFETPENFVFSKYYSGGVNSTRHLYEFDGVNFQSIALEDEYFKDLKYIEKYNEKYYFVNYPHVDPVNLIEYDGSEITLYEFPESYENPVYLSKFNNSLYVVGQNYQDGDIILGFNGNGLEEYEVPNQMEIRDFYFSENSQLLYLNLVDHQTSERTVWIFDGSIYTEIPNPIERGFAYFYGEINGKIALSYFDTTANTNILSLFTYDGNNLTSIPSPENTSLVSNLGSNEEQFFFRYENSVSEKGELYGFNGDALNPIYVDIDKDAYAYEGEFNGKEYFKFFKYDGTESSEFYRYDGASFTEILGPEGLNASYIPGSTNEKLFLNYIDTEDNKTLTELTLGETTTTLIPNPPENLKLFRLLTQYENTFFYSFISESDPNPFPYEKLYSVNQYGITEVEVPEDVVASDYKFTLNQEIFFACYTEDPNTSKLYKINGSDLGRLEAVETNQNITVSPNPAKEYFKVNFTDATIVGEVKVNLFSISGKLIDTQDYRVSSSKPEILYPTESLTSGVYVIEVISSSGKATKRVIVE